MSALETPMTRRLWEELGGTLHEEYLAVRRSRTTAARRLDGLVLLDEPFRLGSRGDLSYQDAAWLLSRRRPADSG